MEIELGARVYSADGGELGIIKRVIVGTITGQVASLVVERGLLLTHAYEVPLSSVRAEAAQRVLLLPSAGTLDSLPPFEASRYTSNVPVATILPAPPAFASTTAGETAVGDTAALFAPSEAGQAVLTTGDRVTSADGEKLGELLILTFDADSGQMVSFVVSSGYLLTEQTVLPAAAIAALATGEITLTETRTQMASAPHEPGASVL